MTSPDKGFVSMLQISIRLKSLILLLIKSLKVIVKVIVIVDRSLYNMSYSMRSVVISTINMFPILVI